jgi:hypothetical protein
MVLCLLDAGSAIDVKRLNGETKLALLDRRSIQRRVEAEAGFTIRQTAKTDRRASRTRFEPHHP